MEQLIKDLKATRENLDVTLQFIEDLPNSRGKALSYTALQKGRMYLGELAILLGADNKYDHSKIKEAKNIPAATDLRKISDTVFKEEIPTILEIREDIEQEIGIFDVITTYFNNNNSTIDRFKRDCYVAESYRSIIEARMWLGVRLEEIRDNAKG